MRSSHRPSALFTNGLVLMAPGRGDQGGGGEGEGKSKGRVSRGGGYEQGRAANRAHMVSAWQEQRKEQSARGSGLPHTHTRRPARRSPWLPLAFFCGLGILLVMEAKGGVLSRHRLLDHPSTGREPLDSARAVVAVLTLVAFALLFMPEPFSM